MRKSFIVPFLLFAILASLACQIAADTVYGAPSPTPTETSLPTLTQVSPTLAPPTLAPTATTLPSPTVTPIVGPVYLSQLEPVSAEVGFATLGVGVWTYSEGDVVEGAVIQSRGVEYLHGLFAHAPSTLIYDLGRNFSSFHTKFFLHGYNPGCVYISDFRFDKNYYNGVTFSIYVDFEKVYESPLITETPPTTPIEVSVDVTGADTLTLIVDEMDQVNYCDISVWGEPYLMP